MAQGNVREYQRAQCIALRKTGMTYRAIGENIGISRASVQRALERFEETGGFQDRPRRGRPKKLNQRDVRMLKHLAKQDDNRSSAPEIMLKINETLEKPWWVNTDTVYGPYTVQIRCFYGRICTVSYTACLRLQSDRRIHPYIYRMYTVFLPCIQCIRPSKYCIPTVYRISYIRYLLFKLILKTKKKLLN